MQCIQAVRLCAADEPEPVYQLATLSNAAYQYRYSDSYLASSAASAELHQLLMNGLNSFDNMQKHISSMCNVTKQPHPTPTVGR